MVFTTINTNQPDVTTHNIQYAGIQGGTVVLPAVVGKSYEIHAIHVNTNSTTDVSLLSGAVQVFYLNAPSAAASNSVGGTLLHIDTPTNTAITINCGGGTFVSITYHLED